MGLFNHMRAWRAALLACGMACFAPVTTATGEPLTVPASLTPRLDSGEPFALAASPINSGGLVAKWRGVAHKLEDERVQLALCDGDREGCVSEAALQFLAIVDIGRAREGRARFGEINRAINLSIRASSDLATFGEMDVWSSPLATFAHGAGDCEDYAIAKFVALRQAGVRPEDLRIIIMRDIFHGEDHAVTAARLDGHWLMLDNRRMAMIEDASIRNYRPLFVIDETGLSRYVDQPLEARATGRDIAPSPLQAATAQPSVIAASN